MHKKIYQTIGLGGTFDHFHEGHAHFLSFAYTLGSHLVIGLTDQKLTKHKQFAHTIENFSTRQNAVRKYCQKHGISHEIVKIKDVYGPTLEDKRIQGLCVTEDTTKGAQMINIMREKLHMRDLPVHVATMYQDATGQVLSSSRIRAGEVNRNGTVYTTLLDQTTVLNTQQKNFFSQIQGKLVTQPSLVEQTIENYNLVCVVGDTTLEKFLKNKWFFSLALYDGKQQREIVASQYIHDIEPDQRVVNDPGTISVQLVNSLKKALLHNHQYIFVEGEEDLATNALVLLLPLQAKIYYGQPDQGMVELIITEQLKHRFYEALLN